MVVALVGAFFGGFGGFFGCGERAGGVLGGEGSVGGWGSRKQALAPARGAVTCTAGAACRAGAACLGAGWGCGCGWRTAWTLETANAAYTAAYTDRIHRPHTQTAYTDRIQRAHTASADWSGRPPVVRRFGLTWSAGCRGVRRPGTGRLGWTIGTELTSGWLLYAVGRYRGNRHAVTVLR